jgi:hypothetical protein
MILTSTLVTDTTTLLGVLTAVADLFTTYPINLFLAGGVIGIVFKIFRQAKGAAR